MSQPSSTLKLAVPRHLQDYNGYCGPACAMMVISSESGSGIPAQQALFRDIREHAKQANDRRPIKSPAESLLALLSKNSRTRWRKAFDPAPEKIAALLVQSVETAGRPCLLLVSKGMHWVVAFGRTLHDDGSVAGVLMRDPAWAGMPAFYGLTKFPEKSTFTHSAEPCTCLQSANPPGSVHERYMALEELVSPRGLQGTPDWEGKGAIALVPEDVSYAAILPPPSAAVPAAAGLTPQAAAMNAVREHGLVGSPDSPPDWRKTLEGGQPGSPILVKDPDDSRDDFYLVPIHAPGASLRTAWIMLDTVTLQLREASLLDHWMVPALPTDQDANNIASEDITLPDGTRHRFKKSELRPNHRNLVWKASAASILPYWPMREFVVPHPVTGEPTSIFVTQHGKIYPALLPDEVPAAQVPPSSPPSQNPPAQSTPKSAPKPGGMPWKALLSTGVAAAGITVAAVNLLKDKTPDAPPPAPPSGVRVGDITASSAVVSWDPAPGATGYSVEYKTETSGTWTFAYTDSAAAARPVMFASVLPVFAQAGPAAEVRPECRRELTMLREDTGYLVRVLTSSSGGKSEASAVVPFRTEKDALLPPQPGVGEITQKSARLTWKAVAGADFYKVELKEAGGKAWSTAAGKLTDTYYVFTDLAPGVSYVAQVTAMGAGKSSQPSEAVEIKTDAIPPNTDLPIVQQRLAVLNDSLKKSYPQAEAVMEKGRALPPELERLKAAVDALEEAPGGEASLTDEGVAELRDYLKMAQAYGGEVNEIKPPHPTEADAELKAFKEAAAGMSAQAGPILRALSPTPGPEFRKSMDALTASVVALADTLPKHVTAHKEFLEYISACDAEATKLTAEAVAMGLGADVFSGKRDLSPDETAKLTGLTDRAFKLAHEVKKERMEHVGKVDTPPDLIPARDKRKPLNYNDPSTHKPDQRALLAELIGAEQVEALFKEAAGFRDAEIDPRKATAFLNKIAHLLFDLSEEKAEHEAALKLLAELEQKVLELKTTKGIARLLGTMMPATDPTLPGRITDLREKVKSYQASLATQKSDHSRVLTELEGDVAELEVLKARYDGILKTLPPDGPQRNSEDQKIITTLDTDFPSLSTSTSRRRESHTKGRSTLPPLDKGAALLLQRLETMLNKVTAKAPAPAKPPASAVPGASAKPKPRAR